MIVQGYHSVMNFFLFGASSRYIKRYDGIVPSYPPIFSTFKPAAANQQTYDGELSESDSVPYYSIQVGTGTTLPKFSDYCLKSMLGRTKLLFGGHSSYIAMKDGVMDRHISRMFTNITNATIAVSEIGLFIGPYMIAREVLEQPVDIPPAGSATFKVQIY